jgi:hypothetical protein
MMSATIFRFASTFTSVYDLGVFHHRISSGMIGQHLELIHRPPVLVHELAA